MPAPDARVPGYLGRILRPGAAPVGTCFQVAPGMLVTACHVLDDLGAAEPGAVVRVDALAGGPAAADARVATAGPAHDLAVLVRDDPLPASVAGVARDGRDGQAGRCRRHRRGPGGRPRPRVRLAGRARRVAGRGDARRPGSGWDGCRRASVLPGMSGAPVRRLADDVVVGVVSARYNSADGWLRDSVWVARTEHLEHAAGRTGRRGDRRPAAAGRGGGRPVLRDRRRPYACAAPGTTCRPATVECARAWSTRCTTYGGSGPAPGAAGAGRGGGRAAGRAVAAASRASCSPSRSCPTWWPGRCGSCYGERRRSSCPYG